MRPRVHQYREKRGEGNESVNDSEGSTMANTAADRVELIPQSIGQHP